MTADQNNLHINGNLIRKVESFRYLGSIMEPDGSFNMDIRKRTCEWLEFWIEGINGKS